MATLNQLHVQTRNAALALAVTIRDDEDVDTARTAAAALLDTVHALEVLHALRAVQTDVS